MTKLSRLHAIIKRVIIGAALILFGLPLLVILIATVWISILDGSNGTIVSSGEEREYLLYVPQHYNPLKPTPLVISMHSLATWPSQQKNMSHWNQLADEHGFIVVYPSGSDVPRRWRVSEDIGLTMDVRFISDLIDRLSTAYNIDPARIYANGLSNGGAMAFVLSCTLSDRVAAVGMVAAALTLPSSWCTDARPVPMIAFHGTADPIIPYNGGPIGDPFNPTKTIFPDVQEWTADWARRNQCATNLGESRIASDVFRIEYTDCADDAAVVLYKIKGGGHTWPGGKPLLEWYVGPTSTGIDATNEMWSFFREHPLAQQQQDL